MLREKLENVAVPGICPGFGDDIGISAAAELAVLGVKTVGEDAEFGDGVEIGDDSGAVVNVFFDVTAVDDEANGKFALAVDGDGAGVEVAGGRKRRSADVLHGVRGDRGEWGDAGLKTKANR